MTPSAGRLFVRPVETPETVNGGRILLTQRTREDWTWGQMEVVSVGAPAYCDDADCQRPHVAECGDSGDEFERRHPNGIAPGEWVLVRHRGLLETPTDKLYVCHQDDVLAILKE